MSEEILAYLKVQFPDLDLDNRDEVLAALMHLELLHGPSR